MKKKIGILKNLRNTTALTFMGVVIVYSAVTTTSAQATTSSATFNVTASISSSCAFTTGALGFGTYNGTAAVTATATIAPNCTLATAYSFNLLTAEDSATGFYYLANAGTSSTNAANMVYFKVGAENTVASPITNAASPSLGGTGSGGAQTVTFYGVIPAQTGKSTGSYSRTLTWVITYS
jgi:spore coat protein U-like protein